ncbi:hypothetical protein F7725_005490 [Dissostichus mawsoni]|uniref:Uncharacterized protein n=1 Tax=Dissostichus mawsoni TaxID=36200 RepID=A0A7J5YRQ0_DISMA|nr:hypothetical protein F7725_005490 [Dissostichus mawsoni]
MEKKLLRYRQAVQPASRQFAGQLPANFSLVCFLARASCFGFLLTFPTLREIQGHFDQIFQQLNYQRVHGQLCDCVIVVAADTLRPTALCWQPAAPTSEPCLQWQREMQA